MGYSGGMRKELSMRDPKKIWLSNQKDGAVPGGDKGFWE